jgi:5'-nucleotidase / UDP-sugar diphosphatase
MLRKVVLSASLLAVLVSGAVMAQDEETFELTVIHTNDEHSHHDPNSSGDGGQARLATVIDQIRASAANSVLLDAGDRFTGTLYHQQWRGQDNAQIMTLLGYDAMALGNHEFDDGDDILAAFIGAVDFPVLSANLTVAEDSPLNGTFAASAVLDVNGEPVGVIGLTTADTANIASPGEGTTFDAAYADVVNAVAAELTEQGINKIILVSHIGYNADVELAASLTNVDVIIGGHSHTLLSNAYTAANGVGYPTEVTGANGEAMVVAQAGGGDGLYLGRLELEFDAAGALISYGGDTVLLSRYITPNADVETLLAELSAPIEELRATPVGDTAVFLDGSRNNCRAMECNLGNLITDAMRAETGAQIAITNGGGIRSSIPVGEDTPEDLMMEDSLTVTLGDVLTVLPFGNLVATMELSGADVIAALENGVSAVGTDSGTGRFPQVSGIRYTFDPAQEVGSRIVSVEIANEDGSFSAIDEAAIYSVATNDFMRRGGDGYTVFAENAINAYDFGRPLDAVVAEYIRNNSPVSPMLDGRIVVVGM